MARVERTLRSYEAGLRVTVRTVAATVQIGQKLPLTVTITNVTADRSVEACLGESRDTTLLAVPLAMREGRSPIAGTYTVIDHPGCVRRFRLAAGEHTSWQEDWNVPDVGAGDAQLTVNLQLVAPSECDRKYGCYATMLRSEGLRLRLERGPEE
jgi:hypothetical protein